MTSDSIQIDFTGQIHNLADLHRELGIPEKNAEVIVVAAWRRWGEALVEHLIGDYALAIRDDARHHDEVGR